MSDDHALTNRSMRQLLALSSLGSPEAAELRRRTPPEVTRRVLAGIMSETAREAPSPAGTGGAAVPYVFLSYAREPGHEAAGGQQAVRRFFHLLCVHLSQLADDIASDERTVSPLLIPGYLAGETAGANGQVRLLDALSSCRVFVPLLSPSYFESAWCRREWETFHRRDEMRRPHHPFGLSAIVPVPWTGIEDLDVPDWAAAMHVGDTGLGPELLDRGIHALLTENGPVYRKAVFRIARHIHDVAECLPAAGT